MEKIGFMHSYGTAMLGLSGKPASAQEVEKIQSCSPRYSEQWAH